MKTNLFSITIFSFIIISINSSLIDEKINSVELDIIQLAKNVENTFLNRCESYKSNSLKCLYIGCSTTTASLTCMTNFPKKDCEKCNPKGRILGKDNVSVLLANKNFPVVDPDDITVRELAYSGINLLEMFKNLHDKNKNFYKWMYFGSRAGTHLKYPGDFTCEQYDNRFRPWYIGAATGAKNFIFILDTSKSMQNFGKFGSMIEATKLLLNTLNNSDYVGLVTFNTKPEFYRSNLVQATSENINILNLYIDTLKPEGGANFSAAFKLVDDLIKNTIADDNGVPCKTFIMSLTDGNPTEGIKEETELIKYIQSLENLKSVIMFTYGFGEGVNISIPKKLACLYNGIFEIITNSSEISEKINSFIITLSLGVETKKPVWTHPYNDASGLGYMTTCAIPVYDRTTSPPFLIGVLGIDIMMADLNSLADNKIVENKLLSKTMQSCTIPNSNKCSLNSIRKDDFICELTEEERKIPCKKIKTSIDHCPNKFGNVFCNQKKIIENNNVINPLEQCCGNCNSGNIGMIVGIIIAAIIFIIGFIYVYKKGIICGRINNQNNDNQNNNNEDNNNQNNDENQNIHNQNNINQNNINQNNNNQNNNNQNNNNEDNNTNYFNKGRESVRYKQISEGDIKVIFSQENRENNTIKPIINDNENPEE